MVFVYVYYSVFIKVMNSPGDGGFHVPVGATISKLIVTCPDGVDLGFSPTHQITSQVYKLVNEGEVDAPFRWDVPPPFVLEPSEGVIPVGMHQNIKVSIYPLEATVFVSQAACHIGEGVFAIIPNPVITTKLSAIGKYAYIVLSEPQIEYKEVLCGTPASKTKKDVLLRNNSVVPAEFTCIRHENDNDEVFDVYPREGVIPPQSSIAINIQYHALAMGTFSSDQYTFKTPGNSATTLTLSGTSIPPTITMRKDVPGNPGQTIFSEGSPHNSINFRDIEVSSTESRLFYLRNESSRDSYYTIDGDEEGVFRMFPRFGKIPALSEVAIKLWFSPKLPINYYKRFFVLIGDALPIFYDVMGTGYIRAKGEIKEIRPFPLRHAHVQAYRNRAVKGIGGMNPDEMDMIVAKEGPDAEIFAHVGQTGTRIMATTPYGNPLTRSGECSRNDIAPAHEYFIDDTDRTSREIAVNVQNLDFGYCKINQRSSGKTVIITNNTKGKVAVNWVSARARGERIDSDSTSVASGKSRLASSDKKPDLYAPAFSITPMTEDINPGASASFLIAFNPLQSNRNYVSDLEAFVYFKNQRTFRLVNDATMTPPWCITVRGIGHTFSTGQLLANCSMLGAATRNGKMVFPCTYLGDAVYQTIMLRNTSNLPSTFRFSLGWEDSSMTSSGTRKSHESSEFTSCTDGTFSVKPMAGEIAAESTILVCFRFQPNTEKKYSQLVKCIVNGAIGGKLMLEGTGGLPCLRMTDLEEAVQSIMPILPPKTQSQYTRLMTADPGLRMTLQPGGQMKHALPNGFQGSFYMKPTSVGLATSRKFTIKNTSRLPLKFICSLPDTAMGILSVSPMQGILRGNQSVQLTISFAPQHSMEYNFKLRVKSFPVGGKPSKVIDARQPGAAQPAIVLQSLSVNVVAPADIGALVFDPPENVLDVLLVNTEKLVPIYIENVSDSDLDYFLRYKTQFIAEPGAYGKVNTEGIVDLEQPSPIENGISVHQLFCNEPVGTINARSRKKLWCTFRPTLAGKFDFTILASIRMVEYGEEGIVENEKAALLRVSASNRDNMMEYAENLAGMPLTTTIQGHATFPTITFEDIRSENESLVSNRDLWQMFSLSEINYDLSLSLTAREFKLNNASSPDTSKMNHYDFHFVPDTVGAPLQVLYIRIKNSGHLPSCYHLHLPNEKSIEPEPWCNVDEPTDEALEMISIIEELKCFSMEPRSAKLMPGDSVQLKISYNHSYLNYAGHHKLSVLLKIDQGKQIILNFIGRTLTLEKTKITHNAEKILLFTPSNNMGIYNFEPVPLGVNATEAPRQQFEIFNPSNTTTLYEIDTSETFSIADNNFDQTLIRFVNPTGTVPPKSSVLIDVYFYPLDSKDYILPIVVRYVDAESKEGKLGKLRTQLQTAKTIREYTMKLKFTGYSPRVGKPVPFVNKYFGGTPPNCQLLNIPSQIVSSNLDVIDFGNVPQYAFGYRVLILRNLTDSEVVFEVNSFTDNYRGNLCHLMNDPDNENRFGRCLSCSPSYGDIDANGSVAISFSFNANCPAAIIRNSFKIVTKAIIKERMGKRKQVKNTTNIALDLESTVAMHTSVVHTATGSHQERLKATTLMNGKAPSMPSTINRRGEMEAGHVYGVESGSDNVVDESTVRKRMGFQLGDSYDGNFLGEPSGAVSAIENTEATSIKSSTSRNSSVRSTKTRSSGQSQEKTAAATKGPLMGPPQVIFVDVLAQVYSVETNKHLLETVMETAPIKDAPTSEFILPKSPRSFIQPMLFADAKPPTFNKLNPDRVAKLVDARQNEVRVLAEDIATALLRDIVSSAEVKEYTEGVLSLPNTGLNLADDYEVSGERPVAITFQEILPEMSLEDATVHEFQNMGYKSIVKSDDISIRPIVKEKNYNITISSLIEGFIKLGVNKKGNTMKKIEELLIEQYGTKSGGKVINVRRLIAAMNPKLGSFLRAKIIKSHAVVVHDETVEEDDDEKNVATPIEVKQDQEEVKDGALELARAIQRANHMIGDRAEVDKVRNRNEEEKASVLLANPEAHFLHDMDGILRNTLFNLIQEAVNDEFSVTSEPIKFLSSPERGRTSSVTLGDF